METKSYVCDMYTIVNLLKKVESIVKDYYSGTLVNNRTLGKATLTLCRCYEYHGTKWNIAAGLTDQNLVRVMETKDPYTANILKQHVVLTDSKNNSIDFRHLCATLDGYLKEDSPIPKEWNGWQGDLTTFTNEILAKTNNSNDFDYLISVSKDWLGNPNSSFPKEDINSDIDAENIYRDLLKNSFNISEAFRNYYYNNRNSSRFSIFITALGGRDEAFQTLMEGPSDLIYLGIGDYPGAGKIPTSIQKGAIYGTLADFVLARIDSSIT